MKRSAPAGTKSSTKASPISKSPPAEHVLTGVQVPPHIFPQIHLAQNLRQPLRIEVVLLEAAKIINSHRIEVPHEDHGAFGSAPRSLDHGQDIVALFFIVFGPLKHKMLGVLLELVESLVELMDPAGALRFTAGFHHAGNLDQFYSEPFHIVEAVQVLADPPSRKE